MCALVIIIHQRHGENGLRVTGSVTRLRPVERTQCGSVTAQWSNVQTLSSATNWGKLRQRREKCWCRCTGGNPWAENVSMNGKLLETSLPCEIRIHFFCKTSSREMRLRATSSIRNPNSNRWPKRAVCKNLRSKHCWSPSSTTKVSFLRNSFLQVKPLMPQFTRQIWTDCCSIFSGLEQNCTELKKGCCSTRIPLHTVR